MIKKELKTVVAFHTSTEAIATEKVCKKENLNGKLISAPREITADCGFAYMVEPSEKEKLKEILENHKIEYDKIVEIEI